MTPGSFCAIGFDPGLNFGWAACDSAFIRAWTPRALVSSPIPRVGVVKSGVRTLSKSGESYGDAGRDLWMFLELLREKHRITHAASEDIQGHFQSQAAAKSQYMCHSVLTMWCSLHGITLVKFRPNSIKLHATGNGSSDQSVSLSQAQLAGYPVKTEHDATAAWALEMMLTQQYQRAHGAPVIQLGGHRRAKKPTAKSGGQRTMGF